MEKYDVDEFLLLVMARRAEVRAGNRVRIHRLKEVMEGYDPKRAAAGDAPGQSASAKQRAAAANALLSVEHFRAFADTVGLEELVGGDDATALDARDVARYQDALALGESWRRLPPHACAVLVLERAARGEDALRPDAVVANDQAAPAAPKGQPPPPPRRRRTRVAASVPRSNAHVMAAWTSYEKPVQAFVKELMKAQAEAAKKTRGMALKASLEMDDGDKERATAEAAAAEAGAQKMLSGITDIQTKLVDLQRRLGNVGSDARASYFDEGESDAGSLAGSMGGGGGGGGADGAMEHWWPVRKFMADILDSQAKAAGRRATSSTEILRDAWTGGVDPNKRQVQKFGSSATAASLGALAANDGSRPPRGGS